jgi:hypothetical protein
MHQTIRALACSAALIAALGLAACGGDDEPDRPAAGDVVAQADVICADANRAERAVVPDGVGWHYGPKFRDPELMTRFTKAGREALAGLRALEPPPADQPGFTEVLSNIDAVLGAIEAEIAGVRSGGDPQTSKHTRAYEKAYADLAVSAGSAGLTECQGVGT